MIPNLDIDLLKTFIAIAEQGSFTRAAGEVNKTQSAVSMQMKRLEDIVQRPLFDRDGRQNRLTPDGGRLLDYARRLTRLNDEAVATFTRPELTGTVRLGTPDDYADRLLPEILGRFSRTHPLVQVDVCCSGSSALTDLAKQNEVDLSIITCSKKTDADEIVRTEPLVWVTSQQHHTHERDPVPVALSHEGCIWRQMSLKALDESARAYRIGYASANSNAINAAVMAGLAVAAIPKIVMRPGMRVLSPEEGFPHMGEFEIGMVYAPGKRSSAVEALACHIAEKLGADRSNHHGGRVAVAGGKHMTGHPDFMPVDPAVTPRFADVATFMRTRRHDIDPVIDIGLCGVPFDLGLNYRSGPRDAPAAVRDASRLIRLAHPTSGIKPYELCTVADIGDAPVNPMDRDDSIAKIEGFFKELKAADIRPISVGGDHTVPAADHARACQR